jgi:hypothetical protein
MTPREEGRGTSAVLAEHRQTPWLIAASPALWALHFMASYVTGAIWCGGAADPAGPIGSLRTAVWIYTALALTGIAVIGAIGARRHRHGSSDLPHDDDTPEDRRRFIGYATLLLSALSAVAVAYAALVVVFIEDCQ